MRIPKWTPVLVGPAAVCLLLVAGMVWHGQRSTRSVRRLLEEERALTLATTELTATIARQIQAGERYLNTPSPDLTADFWRLSQRVRVLQRAVGLSSRLNQREATVLAVSAERLARAEMAYALAHRLVDLGRSDSARRVARAATPSLDEMNDQLLELGVLRADEVTRAGIQFQENARRIGFIQFGLLGAALLIMMSIVVYHRERKHSEARLTGELSQAQLRALRMQINPHFLFNALNSTATLVETGRSERASEAIAMLGDLLRASLRHADAECIPLREELELTRNYLAIQLLRSDDSLEVRCDVPHELLDFPVPAWILQPLVENAIVHGLGGIRPSGRIHIAARASGESVHIQVEDSGRSREQPPARRQGHGVGLANLRSRLEHLYGRGACLELAASDLGGACASIRLPNKSDSPVYKRKS